MRTTKVGKILYISDERLSREKSRLLARTLQAIRSIAEVDVAPGSPTEEEVLKILEEKTYALVLAPWYRYMAWSRVEAFYGLTRTSGPTFAGYFSDTFKPYEIGESPDHYRLILLDFANTQPHEATQLVRSLMKEPWRSGVQPLVDPDTSIYCETWYSGQGQGMRLDSVLGLPEIANSDWTRRSSQIRICLMAFWSLVYEEGPGKGELQQALNGNSPRAYFQVTADRKTLLLRLCYSMANWTPKSALHAFWPGSGKPSDSSQLLLQHSDFVRVHRIAETNDLEIVAGFHISAPSEKAHDQIHTLWIEPLAPHLVIEIPYEAPNPTSKQLKLLPNVPLAGTKLRAEPGTQARERFIVEAAVKIRDLKKLLNERDELIKDLRSGGVGTAPPLPPPDMEALLEAFQERFLDARFQIRQFEIQIHEMESKGATAEAVETLRQKIVSLARKEQAWIRQIAATIESQKQAQKG